MLLPRTHTNVLGENRMAENIVNVMLNFSKKKKKKKCWCFLPYRYINSDLVNGKTALKARLVW